eukprot:5372505-Amphidinium_carterae.1
MAEEMDRGGQTSQYSKHTTDEQPVTTHKLLPRCAKYRHVAHPACVHIPGRGATQGPFALFSSRTANAMGAPLGGTDLQLGAAEWT